MSRPRKTSFGAAMMGYLTSCLLSVGMSLTLIRSLMPNHALWPAALLCAVFSAGFHTLFSVPLKTPYPLIPHRGH